MDKRQLALQIAKYDLRRFSRLGFQTLNPATQFKPNWHIDYLSYTAQRTMPPYTNTNPTPDNPLLRLIVNVPPRTLKTETFSIYLSAFLLGHAPHSRILIATHSFDLAKKIISKIRKITRTEWFQEMFPNTIPVTLPAPLRDTQTYFDTPQGGYMQATTPSSTIIGTGATLIIIDDPSDPESAESETLTAQVNHWYDSELSSRLDDPETGVILHVAQRLSQRDLTSFLLEQNSFLKPPYAWEHIVLPARATETTTYHYYQTEYTFHENSMLTPRISSEFLDTKFASNSLSASGMYQQNPLPLGQTTLSIQDLQTPYEPTTPPSRIIISADTSSKISNRNDYSVFLVFYEYPDGHTVLNALQYGRWEFTDLQNITLALTEAHKPHAVLIEDKSSGQQLIQNLRLHTTPVPIVPITPTKSKEIRAEAARPYLQTHRFHLPANYTRQPWYPEFVTQINGFPKAKHDDMVDALTQYIHYYAQTVSHRVRVRQL